MDDEAIDRAAALLARARRSASLVDCIPGEIRPGNLEEAYAVQDRLIEQLGREVGGWFCACTNPAIQSMLGLDEPYYARLLDDRIFQGPVTLRASEYPPIVLECEFGFRLGRDLPPRADPYSEAEVRQAIAAVCPAIEVVAGHLADWPNQDVWSVIADNGTDGALVHGPGVEDWQSIDLASIEVSLEVNGETVRTGTGANVLGDPVGALTWLANARARDGEGLRAGDIHNTGTATDIYWMSPGEEAVARFDGLGEVRLTLEP